MSESQLDLLERLLLYAAMVEDKTVVRDLAGIAARELLPDDAG